MAKEIKKQEVETVEVETTKVETTKVETAEVDKAEANVTEKPKKEGFWKSKTGKTIIRIGAGMIAFGLGATAASFVNNRKNETTSEDDEYSNAEYESEEE